MEENSGEFYMFEPQSHLDSDVESLHQNHQRIRTISGFLHFWVLLTDNIQYL